MIEIDDDRHTALLAAQMAHRDDAVSHSILTSTASVLLPKLGVDPKYLDDEILS